MTPPAPTVQAGGTGTTSSLLRVEVDEPIQDLGLPVYAHLRDSDGNEYALVIAPVTRLQSTGRPYRVIDDIATPGAYLLALERRKGARAVAAPSMTILHDDGQQVIVRNGPGVAEALAGLGFDVRVLPSTPIVLRASVPPVTPGLAIAYDPRVATMISEVLQSTLYDVTGNLAGDNAVTIGGSPYTITTRNTGSGAPIQQATQYVYECMEGMGLAVSYQNWSTSRYSNRNVIGAKTGKTRPTEIVLVTAHLDDMPRGSTAPGADDNASGSAAVLVASQILASRDFERTVRFVFFTGEEQGLYGSDAYAHAAGRVDVVVTNTNGGTATRARAFTFVVPPTITSITPTSGRTAGSTRVTVRGTGVTTHGVPLQAELPSGSEPSACLLEQLRMTTQQESADATAC